jgi:hypothetical protein
MSYRSSGNKSQIRTLDGVTVLLCVNRVKTDLILLNEIKIKHVHPENYNFWNDLPIIR